MTLLRTGKSTTYTETGPVKHEEGLDLVYANASTIGEPPKELVMQDVSSKSESIELGSVLNTAPSVSAQGTQIGTAFVCVLPKPEDIPYDKAFKLSDHLPVLVQLKGL